MPDYLHRTTKVLLESWSQTDLPEPIANYIEEPDLSAVAGWDSKYWTITGDVVSLMSQAERDAVDAAEAAQLLTDNRAAAVAAPDDTVEPIGWETRGLIELLNKRDNYIINRITEIQNTLVAIRDQTFGTQARQNVDAGFPMATATRTRADAVQAYKDDINAGNVDT